MFKLVRRVVDCSRADRCATVVREWQKREKTKWNRMEPERIKKLLHEKMEPVVQVGKRHVLNNDAVVRKGGRKPVAGRNSEET